MDIKYNKLGFSERMSTMFPLDEIFIVTIIL